MHDREVDLPDLGVMGDSWGLGFERFDTPDGAIIGHDGSTIGQNAFLRMVPEAGVAVALLTNGGDVISLYHDIVGPRARRARPTSRCPPLPTPPASPSAIDASRYVGTYSAEVADLVVSQDDDGRIWLDLTPKGLFEELGEKPERSELVHYSGDSLIPLEPDQRDAHAARLRRRRRRRPRPLPARRPRRPARRRLTHHSPAATNEEPHMKLTASSPLAHLRHRRPPRRVRRRQRRRLQRPDGGGDSEYVDGGTFTMALEGDPGKLDPQSSASSALFTVNQLAYDNLVAVDAKTGEIQSQLATEWKVDGTTVTLTLAEGITCSDGSDFTATTAADNIAYVGDPKNKSPYLGAFLPVGRDREGRRRRRHRHDHAGPARAVRAQRPRPACRWSATPAWRTASRWPTATDGTGPYVLTEAVPGDHYTYEIRDGYTWGPDGATTAEKGMPDTIVMKIIENESTAANLLVSGEINAATVIGPGRQAPRGAGPVRRRDARPAWASSGTTTTTATRPATPTCGWRSPRRSTSASSPSVATAGAGTPATTLAAIEPVACPGDSVSGSLPAQDVDAAKAVLDRQEAHVPLLQRRGQRRGRRRGARRPAVGGRRRRGDRQGRGRDRAPGRHLRHR